MTLSSVIDRSDLIRTIDDDDEVQHDDASSEDEDVAQPKKNKAACQAKKYFEPEFNFVSRFRFWTHLLHCWSLLAKSPYPSTLLVWSTPGWRKIILPKVSFQLFSFYQFLVKVVKLVKVGNLIDGNPRLQVLFLHLSLDSDLSQIHWLDGWWP